jgi:hypothetical protein
MSRLDIENTTCSEDIPVKACAVTDCSYNRSLECHAPGIAVGDVHAACDTFTVGPVSVQGGEARVLRCLVEDCVHNGAEECHACGIDVSYHSAHADCMTFQPRT